MHRPATAGGRGETRRQAPWRAALGALAFALVSGVTNAWGGPVEGPVTTRDDAGQVFSSAAPVQRIIALAPNLTELVFAAGGGDKLVGVARFSDYPAAARALPLVGDAFALNVEAIVALKPDLVLTWRSGLGQRQQERLRSLGLPVWTSEIDSVEGIADTLRRLGVLMGTSPAADRAAGQVMARWTALEARYADRPPVRVFYQLSTQPLMTVNGEHLVSHTIAACGGVNAFKSLPSLAPTISWEAAAQSNPQLIAMAHGGNRPPDWGRWPALSEVDAVRHQAFASLPPDLLSRMGPRFVEGAELLCAAIDRVRPPRAR